MAPRAKNPLIRKSLGKPKDINLRKLPAHVKVWLAEPKLDGLRGIIVKPKNSSKAKAYSSNGCDVPNAKYICRAIAKAFPKKDEIILDGEFFTKNWNETQSIVMAGYARDKAKKLYIRLFDVIPSYLHWTKKTPTENLRKRKVWLNALLKKIASKRVVGVPFKMVKNNAKTLETFYRRMLKEGHEGAMFKDPEAGYPYKRSNDWLRWKPKETDDCKVLGIKPGKGKFEGLIGSLHCTFKHPVKGTITFNCSGMDDDERKKLTAMHKKNKLVGKIVEIEHEGVTVGLKVRFPEFKRMRPDKD